MNIIFMRHGQATNNVNEIISDKEIYWSILTENGIDEVQKSVESLPSKVDKIYTSPLPRTIETAHFVSQKYLNLDVVVENRIREINNGKYSGKKNNEDLDDTRNKQIKGDYFIRFGEYGENKYDIELRLCKFLTDVFNDNLRSNTIVIVSHGSVTSYMKRLLKIKTPHLKTGKIEEFKDVDFKPVFDYQKKLCKIKKEIINKRIDIIKSLMVNDSLKTKLSSLIKKEFNSTEFSDSFFKEYIDGLSSNNMKKINKANFDSDIILICFYNSYEGFMKKWFDHYIKIGIKNYVLVNTGLKDNSVNILNNYNNIVNIEMWSIDEESNYYKNCGYKQRLLDYYGINKKYLIVNQDELFIYKDYETISLDNYINNNEFDYIKIITLDVYANKNIHEGCLDDYKYVDKNTYKISTSDKYVNKVYGGPYFRVFKIKSNLQKIPFIKYTGNELYVCDNYYYPYNINDKALFTSYLLSYKLLFNKSKESKLLKDNDTNLFDKNISIPIDEIDYLF